LTGSVEQRLSAAYAATDLRSWLEIVAAQWLSATSSQSVRRWWALAKPLASQALHEEDPRSEGL
jgi:hypothetical protein